MTLSFFITVIPDHDKPQPPGCLLERGHTKADIVADVLATAGFPDFGDQLKLLATSSLQKTHKLA
ncbi:hypothetical protein AAL50_15220 [Salmonella enterica subsp. enterica serovar Typhimurium]|nr:hypothetical protein [Salmonella enterica subsp. enterica serovar Typhimurium]ECV9164634.1 hypothetical protein [Salmonella enterica subsp. enterica serovar Typhimurium]